MLDQSRAVLHPVARVEVEQHIGMHDAGCVNVPADHALARVQPGMLHDLRLEVADELDAPLDSILQHGTDTVGIVPG